MLCFSPLSRNDKQQQTIYQIYNSTEFINYKHLLWLPLPSEFDRDSVGSRGKSNVMKTSSSPTECSYFLSKEAANELLHGKPGIILLILLKSYYSIIC